MQAYEELASLANEFTQLSARGEQDDIKRPVETIQRVAEKVGKSFSGSWLGYHSCIYYEGLTAPPPGMHFSQEWGLRDFNGFMSMGTNGAWKEYDPHAVKNYILSQSGVPDLDEMKVVDQSIREEYATNKLKLVSILTSEIECLPDSFLENMLTDLKRKKILSPHDVIDGMSPNGQLMTRDSTAVSQGIHVPPHISILAEVYAIKCTFQICKDCANIASQAASHIQRKTAKSNTSGTLGMNVFIGHGRSQTWHDLKDFIQDRLRLPWDEFNRVPVAGVTNIVRLSQMLESARIAFLVMTAEDETADGRSQARMNVVHEAGLFQGRLGFNRAIVLLEEGCEEFSNINGLGQIRFPKGQINAAFEQIRGVLEREGLIT
jgi:predicted nucleotide-binding protein